jgi:opacity protein-like surface antigen
MKRLVVMAVTAIAALAGPATAAQADSNEYGNSLCQQRPFMCVDPMTSIGANGTYTGHDEPSVIFQSKRHGTGNNLTYFVTLPKDPPTKPNQAGTAGTWNFQLRATYWLGLTMCDSQSWPNYTHTCKADSDANAKFRSFNPKSKHYIGKGPGNAYMELQFYTPGWVPQFTGFGCTATKWCANMTIDSFNASGNNNVSQNADCLNNHFLVGPEPINWAYVTKSGKSQAPANPLFLSDDPSFKGLNPDPSKDLLMNGGDKLRVHMHDTRAGFRADIYDLTTHQHGSMTASKANGFGQILYQPKAKTCHERPYAFHPMYNSAVKRGTTWTAHTYNVAASDEIGHFEYCNAIDPNSGDCTSPGAGDTSLDADDEACLDGASLGALIPIMGCVLDDGDFDGPSYQHDWPGSFTNPTADAKVHSTPFRFTVPTTRGKSLDDVAFEADMARIERGEPGNPPTQCDAITGAHCTNPPIGAKFYPIYSLAKSGGKCWFQQGDVHIPGTFDLFGGSSTTEYGHLLFVKYPGPGFTVDRFAEDFRRDLHTNPCNS